MKEKTEESMRLNYKETIAIMIAMYKVLLPGLAIGVAAILFVALVLKVYL